MISPYKNNVTINEKKPLNDDLQENGFSSGNITEKNIDLEKSNTAEYDEIFIDQIYNDIINNLTSKNTQSFVCPPYNDKYYDMLPDLSILCLNDNSKFEDFERVLGKPTASLYLSSVPVSNHEWQYRLANGESFCVEVSRCMSDERAELTTEISKPHLLRLQLYILRESLNDPVISDETKRENEALMSKLNEEYTKVMKDFCDSTIKDVEQFCGHEIPLIYDEEYVWTLNAALSNALHDYSKNVHQKNN